MNLLFDSWIEVEHRSGKRARIAPVQMTAQPDDPIVDLLAPRADFQGALYQFLIGALQTASAPDDLTEWKERWTQPPSEAQLETAFDPYRSAFELDSAGPAFMQDFDLPQTEPIGIAALLIEAPGEKTVTDNNDHFVHRDGVQQVCPACAAQALLTLQLNAPSGGAGHRVSVRGGGPLTTLVLPNNVHASLWHKLWLNILPLDELDYSVSPVLSKILPWMAPTRTSDPRGVGDTTPETVHLLQVYWSMPRRIRLDFTDTRSGDCDLCGDASASLVLQYRTRNYGVNYTGAWLHPLTPYSYDPKSENVPLPLKGQIGGIGYRHWLGLTLGNDAKQPAAAQVVSYSVRSFDRLPECDRTTRLWCFGYDMSNAKARCWYDATLPLYSIPPELQEDFAIAVKALLDVAGETAYLLHKQVKAAWFKRPGDVNSEPAVQLGFWQSSEAKFYLLLDRLAHANLGDQSALAPLYLDWLRATRSLALRQFDEWVLAGPIEEMNMQRVVKARTDLGAWLNKGKSIKPLWKLVETHMKESA